MNVYALWHERPLEGQEDLDPVGDYIDTEDKLCGIFSSRDRAEQARRQLVEQPGFRDYPNDFHLYEHEVDTMQWTEGFITLADDE
jgi:homoserine kinase type II